MKKKENITIFVVENDLAKRQSISSRLRSVDFIVESPMNGFQLFHLLEKTSCSLLLVFSNMEDMSAVEIISLSRNMSGFPVLAIKKDEIIEMVDDTFTQEDNFNILLKKINALLLKSK